MILPQPLSVDLKGRATPVTAQQEWTRAGLLAAFALVGTGLVAYTHQQTEQRIEANERAALLDRLRRTLPAGSYDNDIADDVVYARAPGRLGSPEAMPVYRARSEGRPVAAVLTVVAPDGYNGAIRLLVGVRRDGTVAGVRVVSHQETPGLGDYIEADKSDWIEQFTGRALGDPPAERWRVGKDGGAFEALTGATITPRAVLGAVRNALIYFRDRRQALFTADPGTTLAPTPPPTTETPDGR